MSAILDAVVSVGWLHAMWFRGWEWLRGHGFGCGGRCDDEKEREGVGGEGGIFEFHCLAWVRTMVEVNGEYHII